MLAPTVVVARRGCGVGVALRLGCVSSDDDPQGVRDYWGSTDQFCFERSLDRLCPIIGG